MAGNRTQQAVQINRNMKEKLSAMLASEMKKRGITQREAADLCGTYASAINRILNPKVKTIDFITVTKISLAFGYAPNVSLSKLKAA